METQTGVISRAHEEKPDIERAVEEKQRERGKVTAFPEATFPIPQPTLFLPNYSFFNVFIFTLCSLVF